MLSKEENNLVNYGSTTASRDTLHRPETHMMGYLNGRQRGRNGCDADHIELGVNGVGSVNGVSNHDDEYNPAEATSDPWALTELADTSEKWSDLDSKGKVTRVLLGIAKLVALLLLLYFFVCSLDILSSAFRLVGGRTTGEIFSKSDLLQNPVVGIMIGILTTVLVQSSSTSSSIIVSMVSANFLEVRVAIPIIMGANIGTSVTNTIVSLTQMGDRNEFRRAFAAATVHDMFNWLSVIVLFLVEMISIKIFGLGYLEALSGAVTEHLGSTSSKGGEIKLLNAITEPLTKLIVQIDKGVIEGWSRNDSDFFNASLIKQNCTTKIDGVPTSSPCKFLFRETGLTDAENGLVLLALSLTLLCGCLVCIVKVLNSMLKGQIANVIRRVINANIPYVPWITGYLAIVIGAVMTFLVQSSSVFTSALTPLVGVGVITVERVYPLTLGSNIGTTTTSVIAALAASPEQLRYTLQIALCHFFFNVTGIFLFYPIPFTRFPIPMAKFLGDTTAKYRWFSIAYLVLMFFVVPGIVLGLSVAGPVTLIVILSPLTAVVVLVVAITVIQRKMPSLLPPVLRTWKWLPEPLRSLEPMDRLISRCVCCKRSQSSPPVHQSTSGINNPGFE